jgi:hypothetical protein
MMLDNEQWRLERGTFVAQTDGYNCGPIACLKVLEMYSLVSVDDVKLAYSLNSLRKLVIDKWKRFIDYCDHNLVVWRRFEVPMEEPRPLPGFPLLPTATTIDENETAPQRHPAVADAVAASSKAPPADLDICFCAVDDISMELIEMKC